MPLVMESRLVCTSPEIVCNFFLSKRTLTCNLSHFSRVHFRFCTEQRHGTSEGHSRKHSSVLLQLWPKRSLGSCRCILFDKNVVLGNVSSHELLFSGLSAGTTYMIGAWNGRLTKSEGQIPPIFVQTDNIEACQNVPVILSRLVSVIFFFLDSKGREEFSLLFLGFFFFFFQECAKDRMFVFATAIPFVAVYERVKWTSSRERRKRKHSVDDGRVDLVTNENQYKRRRSDGHTGKKQHFEPRRKSEPWRTEREKTYKSRDHHRHHSGKQERHSTPHHSHHRRELQSPHPARHVFFPEEEPHHRPWQGHATSTPRQERRFSQESTGSHRKHKRHHSAVSIHVLC